MVEKVICLRDDGSIDKQDIDNCTPISIVQLSDGSEATLYQLKVDWLLDNSNPTAITERIRKEVSMTDLIKTVEKKCSNNWIPNYRKFRNELLAKIRPNI